MMSQMLTNTVVTRAAATAAPRAQRVQSVRPAARSVRRSVRAAASGPEAPVSTSTPATPMEASASSVEPVAAMANSAPPIATTTSVDAQSSGFLGATQELMNGRAAMLGFVIALGMEVTTGKSVGGQLFDEVVQKSTKVITHSVDGFALSSFAFVVLAVTMATLAPMINGEANGKRSIGPFTPDAELQNSRVAMLGFAGLLAVEAIKGSALF